MTNQLKVLDCTLRDGGYYNNWDFDEDLVRDYLNALAEAKIDYIELGLRNFPKCTFDGPFAYTKESYLNSIVLPPGPKYGVMIDAKTILSSNLQVEVYRTNIIRVDSGDRKRTQSGLTLKVTGELTLYLRN